METLALFRDISLVYLLIVFCLPIGLIPLAAFFFAQKYLRVGRNKLKPLIQTGQLWAKRAETETNRAARRVIQVPIAAQAGVKQAQATAEAMRKEFFDTES